jgi:SAM-dependent methyltransferase
MPSETYKHLAQVYKHLMRGIDYKIWAEYIQVISKDNRQKNPCVLELSCGLGSLAGELKKSFKNYFISDLSYQMLVQLKDLNLPKVCCDMTLLPFNKVFDLVLSTFDSVNYLTTKEKIMKFLSEVSSVLKQDGILTFDVSLEKNSLRYQRYLNRSGKVGEIKYKQKSYFNPKSRIHYNYFDILLADGTKVEEIHKQKIFHFDDYFKFIEDSDFYVSNCFETFTFNNANTNTERAQFILKKKV